MEIRLISTREDFEKAFNLLNQKEYALSFYEYFLKHDQYSKNHSAKLIGVFKKNIDQEGGRSDDCVGSLSYRLITCKDLGRILEVKEIYYKDIKAYESLLDFLDDVAVDEMCNSIKICKNQAERMNFSIFDKVENYFKNLNF